MKPIRFHPLAEDEMIDAALWYEEQQKDLGKRFLAAIQDCLNKIEINPMLFPCIDGDSRRSLVKTFPFGVIFQIQPDRIVIQAVMHLHRNPGHWKQMIRTK